MCMGKPKIPKTPAAAQMQAMVAPKDMAMMLGRNRMRRRGMWSTVFTGPSGIGAAPMVTGTSGGMTGG